MPDKVAYVLFQYIPLCANKVYKQTSFVLSAVYCLWCHLFGREWGRVGSCWVCGLFPLLRHPLGFPDFTEDLIKIVCWSCLNSSDGTLSIPGVVGTWSNNNAQYIATVKTFILQYIGYMYLFTIKISWLASKVR